MKTETLNTMSISEFVKINKFDEIINVVRTNSNGYPFVTFIKIVDNKSIAENVYFSKAASANVSLNDVVTIDMINTYRIAKTTNADGEVRTKLVSSVSNRISLASLLG